ncbi:MAG: exopolysaccharide Pel transporter PelG [Spirochaetales bacterium]|nr:exopolysaccharide Pel transporter PelG [Spirochaetales bacterium]
MREINFQLVNIKRRSEPDALRKPHLFTDIYFSSPWLIVFLAVLLVGMISYYFKDSAEGEFNYRVLIFTAAGALLLSGGFNMLFMRFLLVRNRALSPDAVKSSLSGGLLVLAFLAFAASGAFLYAWDMPLSHKVFIILFFVLLCVSLGLFVIHSTLGSFPAFAAVYLVLLLSVPGAGLVGKTLGGPLGYFLGLALAQVIIFFIQWFLFSHQFGFSFAVKADLFSHARRDPGAIAVGLLLAYGIFADKLVAWIFGIQYAMLPLFQATFNVNTAFSLAFVFVLPAFVYFVLRVEKPLYRRYRDFYECLRLKGTLEEVDRKKDEITAFILKKAGAVLKILLSCVFLFTYFATQVYAILGLDLEDVPLFRAALWGNALYVLFTCVCIFLAYAEFEGSVLFLYGLFAALNTLLPILNILVFKAHPLFIFPTVCLVSLLCAAPLTARYLTHFLELHLRRPPLGIPFRRVKDDEHWVQLVKEEDGRE